MTSTRKHLVLLADSYYPNLTMNGMIAQRIIDEIKEKFDVSVISYATYAEEHSKNVCVKTVFFWSVYYDEMFSEKERLATGRLERFFYKLCLRSKRAISFASRNRNILGINRGALKKILEALEEVEKRREINVIFSVAAPFEFQLANYIFSSKYRKVKSIVYQVDFWALQKDSRYPNFLYQIRKKKRINQEKKISEVCDYFMLPFVKEAEGKLINDKAIKECAHPLLVENKYMHNMKNNNEITQFVYAGSLIQSFRSPRELIQIIIKYAEYTRCQIHFFHRGNCESIIKSASDEYPEVFVDHGQVSSEVVQEALAASDVLISIGTVKGDQIAGKTFEYLSTGKKILYIYWAEKDLNAEFLSRYPLALCLNVTLLSVEECVARLDQFIKENRSRQLSFEEVSKIYEESLPRKAAEKMFGRI